MIYISGFREYQCRDYARWLELGPTEWRYVYRAMQLQGTRGELFIELDGMWKRDYHEHWAIIGMIKDRKCIHVRVEW